MLVTLAETSRRVEPSSSLAGFEQLSAGGWKQLARAWPRLAIVRLGGSAAASSEALKALPHILPGIRQYQPAAAAAGGTAAAAAAAVGGVTAAAGSTSADAVALLAAAVAAAEDEQGLGSWEDAFASDSEQDDEHFNSADAVLQRSATPSQQEDSSSKHVQQQATAAADCRLKELRVLVWPDVPPEAVQLVQQRCPRVAVNPSLLPDAASGQLPPPEVDPRVPLDAAAMALVGPQALQVGTNGAAI
jgi:hypothetical protein